MKKIRYIFLNVAILIGLVFFSHCSSTEQTSWGKTTYDILKTKTWKIKSVTVDGVDKTGSYLPNLTLTFSGDFDKNDLQYSTTNGGGAWPASGKFKFLADTKIQRDDEVEIDVTEYVIGSLKLEFDWNGTTTYGGGRASGTKGKHVFQFE